MGRRPRACTLLAGVAAFVALTSGAASADPDDYADAFMPPSWQSTRPTGTTTDDGDILGEGRHRPRSKRPERPWYDPRFAFGIGANVPELLPMEGYAFFGRYFALRAFYTPPLPVSIRVNMPSDVIATTQGAVAVANPAFTINGKLTYGPHYGLESLVFPWGGSFFLGAGASYRKVRLVADAKSPVLVCSLIEAAKDPPCGDPNAAIETRTELTAHADVTTEALLMRASLGWFWDVGKFGYFMFNAGATKPTAVHRTVNVDVGLATPENPNPEITGALGQIRAERQGDLQQQAVQAVSPYDQKILPIFGVGAGVRF